MKKNIISRSLMIASLAILPFASQAVVQDDADIVELRTDCTGPNGSTMDNCFDSSAGLVSWIKNARNPIADASAPLQINIGPGTFDPIDLGNDTAGCHISMVGSGRQNTRIVANGYAAFQFPSHCVLSVSEITFENTNIFWGIIVAPGNLGLPPGETTWDDVDVIGVAYGWQGGGDCDTKHSWFNSRIIAKPKAGIARAYSTCAEDWFYASEVTSIAAAGDETPNEMFAIQTNGEAHFYGSIIRVIAEEGINLPAFSMYQPGGGNNPNQIPFTTGMLAVNAYGTGEVHIHGSAIDVLSTENNDVQAIAVISGGHVHANETSYNMKTSGGVVTRLIDDGGHIRAPAVWESSDQLHNIISITGQDSSIYTGDPSGHPHHVIYDSSCNSNWFDTTANQCI